MYEVGLVKGTALMTVALKYTNKLRMEMTIEKVKQLCPGVALERFAYEALEMKADPGGKTFLIGQLRLTQKSSKLMLPRNRLALSVANLVRLRICPCLHELCTSYKSADP